MYQVPQEIKNFLKDHFSSCNKQLSYDLSIFPGIREETLDNNFISYFSRLPGPLKFNSNWTLRIDAHFIGGSRHFQTWEVADIGLMIIFRRNGKIVRSKMVFLQSKKLYPDSIKYIDIDPYLRDGMGRLLVTEKEHLEIVKARLVKFEEKSKYKAFKKNNDQQRAMSSFEERFKVDMYYLFYNPMIIPHDIKTPLEDQPELNDNKIGCRVVVKKQLDEALLIHPDNYTPSFGDVKYMLTGDHLSSNHEAGWRLEHFVIDLVMGCKQGLIDESPNFNTLQALMSQKSSPISAALSITVDLSE